ncbi:hypothetical protein GCM10025868_40610 [Angustibacter aerolatus]|uniref:SRP54-type proteins GTP-binding domain-containing protein n=1 Tax=Angustibacter aerolatus TaxID=1162965 RepID=A0ABQ6JKM6_9ACTN|nr:hypothetical protein GCM10025868_40610 [Angustibacter aerolatus]
MRARRPWRASLARYLRAEGHTPLLVAADLQRPNAVTQAQVVGERAGVPVYAPEPGNQGVDPDAATAGDPVSVARGGVAEATARHHDVVIVDTAGRLGIDQVLMQQAGDIRAAVQPDEVLFVIDAMIGQDAVTTAQAFLDGVDFTGVVLTKARRRRARWRRPVGGQHHRAADHVRVHRREAWRTSRSSTPTGWPGASSTWATC